MIKPSNALKGWIVLGLIAGYGLTRLYNLTLLPIFADEAIHIQWAADVWHGEPWKPLIDGKLLQVWLTALVIPWTPDSLWASRFISVLSGGLAMWAGYQISKRLHGDKIGLFS